MFSETQVAIIIRDVNESINIPIISESREGARNLSYFPRHLLGHATTTSGRWRGLFSANAIQGIRCNCGLHAVHVLTMWWPNMYRQNHSEVGKQDQ